MIYLILFDTWFLISFCFFVNLLRSYSVYSEVKSPQKYDENLIFIAGAHALPMIPTTRRLESHLICLRLKLDKMSWLLMAIYMSQI